MQHRSGKEKSRQDPFDNYGNKCNNSLPSLHQLLRLYPKSESCFSIWACALVGCDPPQDTPADAGLNVSAQTILINAPHCWSLLLGALFAFPGASHSCDRIDRSDIGRAMHACHHKQLVARGSDSLRPSSSQSGDRKAAWQQQHATTVRKHWCRSSARSDAWPSTLMRLLQT